MGMPTECEETLNSLSKPGCMLFLCLDRAWVGHGSGMGRAGSGLGLGRAWVGHGSGWVGLVSGMGRAWVGHGSGRVGACSLATSMVVFVELGRIRST